MWLYIPDVAISNTFLVTPTGSFGLGVGEWLYNGTAFSVITAANPLPIAPANVSGSASPFLMQFPFDVSAYAQLVGFFLGLFVLSYGVGAIYRLFVPSRFS